MAEHIGESQAAHHLSRPSSAQNRPTRSKQAAEVGPPIAVDQSGKNAGVAAKVDDDFVEAIPVTARELEVIETYLGAALDEWLEVTD